jgi:hypothetical protein
MSEAEACRSKAGRCTELAESSVAAEDRDALRGSAEAWLDLARRLDRPPLRILWADGAKPG